MTSQLQQLQDSAIPLAITQGARQAAQRFAEHHTSPDKRSQIYLNTLAVCTVNDYLQMIGVATDIAASDSWSPILQYGANVADLALVDLGHLECRPILPSETTYALPLETPENRIGVVVVEVDESQRRATLLGFSKTLVLGDVPLNQLQPIDELLVHIESLESRLVVTTAPDIQLSEWFNGLFEAGWQTIKTALGREPGTLALGFRTVAQPSSIDTVKRAKLLDLGVELGTKQVVLLITASYDRSDQMEIRAQLHPSDGAVYLPPELKLSLLSETGDIIQEVPSRQSDNLIQLPNFQCTHGERFQIRISLGSISLTENFIA